MCIDMYVVMDMWMYGHPFLYACMWVYIYICVVYVYTCIQICIYIYTYICIDVHLYVHVCMYVYVCMCACMNVRICLSFLSVGAASLMCYLFPVALELGEPALPPSQTLDFQPMRRRKGLRWWHYVLTKLAHAQLATGRHQVGSMGCLSNRMRLGTGRHQVGSDGCVSKCMS